MKPLSHEEFSRRGGSAKSKAKTIAARLNAKKPRKPKPSARPYGSAKGK